jgi:hypothetical protein
MGLYELLCWRLVNIPLLHDIQHDAENKNITHTLHRDPNEFLESISVMGANSGSHGSEVLAIAFINFAAVRGLNKRWRHNLTIYTHDDCPISTLKWSVSARLKYYVISICPIFFQITWANFSVFTVISSLKFWILRSHTILRTKVSTLLVKTRVILQAWHRPYVTCYESSLTSSNADSMTSNKYPSFYKAANHQITGGQD